MQFADTVQITNNSVSLTIHAVAVVISAWIYESRYMQACTRAQIPYAQYYVAML